MEFNIPLMLDISILVLLFVTIIFAARLSLMLKNFRESREELNKVIRNLNKRIDKADQAVEGMRATAKDSGRDLQELIKEAKIIADELQLVNEAGGNMANRLTALAEKNSLPHKQPQHEHDIVDLPRKKKTENFAIRDLDAERDDDDTGNDNSGMSRAEIELLEAMQSRR